jgi:hypothetical protein
MTVLALALILGSISVASAASGKVKLTDIADNANEEAIQVAYDLDIVTGTPEGTYEPTKAVNRAEFAALIVRALAVPESALSSYSSTTFKDTSGYTWAVPYLAILQQKGIMKGDGYGNAMPGRQINPNEAVTMVLRAIGYTDNASELVGQWPANYISLGQRLNLYEKVSNDVQMNKAAAAQMIYNVLSKPLVQVDANSTVKYLYDAQFQNVEQTLLTQNLNCEPVRGDGDGKAVVTYSDADKSKINLIHNVGAYGKLYRSKADKEIVAFTEKETVFLAGKFTYNTNDETLNKFKAMDGTEYSLDKADAIDVIYSIARHDKVPSGTSEAAIFFNGEEISNPNTTINGNPFKKYIDLRTEDGKRKGPESKVIIAAEVKGQAIYKIRSVAVWDAGISIKRGDYFLYQANQIDEKKFNGHDFPLDENNARDDSAYVLEGVKNLDEIQADNVVYLYKNENETIRRIEVGTETQSGVITNINATDSQHTIGGKVLGDAPYKGPGWSDLGTVNNEGTALLDFYGRTFAFKLGEASKGNFAIITGKGNKTGLDDARYRLFDKTGKDVLYYVAKDGTYNNNKVITSETNIEGNSDFGTNGTLVGYTLSGEKLKTIRSATSATKLEADEPYGYVDKTGTLLKVNGINKRFAIDGSVLVYVAEYSQTETINDAEFSIGSIKDLLDKDIKKEFWYIADANDSNLIKALLVRSTDTGAQNIYVMINGLQKGSNGANGEIDVVKGLEFADGINAKDKTWEYVNIDLRGAITSGNNIASGGLGLETDDRYGALVKFTVGGDGVLKSWDDQLTYYKLAGDTLDPWYARGGSFRSKLAAGVAQVTASALHYVPKSMEGRNIQITDGHGHSDRIALADNAVLYQLNAARTAWTVTRPNDTVLSYNVSPENPARYVFVMTDKDKGAHDVIIQVAY